ncbi:MAG: hemolysin family protein [Nitriliruptorales bacterium]|nr:hemolysin family protein [Nitriliruptorales bacterium]
MARADLILLGVLVGLIGLAAALAAAETALVRLSEARAQSLEDEQGRVGGRVARLVSDRSRALPAILLAALLVQISAASVASVLAARLFGAAAVAWAAVTLTLVMFVYGEVLPKGHAVERPGSTLSKLSLPVTALVRVLAPVVRVVHAFAALHGSRSREPQPSVTEPELRWLADRAAREGAIEAEDRRLIEAAFAAGDRPLGKVLVPRNEIVAIGVDTPMGAALDAALGAGHRRVVVFEGDLDNTLGYVHLADLARASTDPDAELAQFLRAPLALPETRSVVETLREMQRHRVHLALVLDEFGGVAGLVTIEDLVEELLGTVADETSPPVSDIEAVDGNAWLIAGDTPIEDVAATLGIEFPEGDWNTIAGLAAELGGEVLQPGDEVEGDGYSLKVVAGSARRIEHLVLTVDAVTQRTERDP